MGAAGLGQIKISLSLPKGMAITNKHTMFSLNRVKQNLSIKIRSIFKLKNQLCPDQQEHLKVHKYHNRPHQATVPDLRSVHRKMVPALDLGDIRTKRIPG